MKRRTILRSLISIPAAAAVPTEAFAQQTGEKTAVREKGVPAGPPLVAPGTSETPTVPVVNAGENAELEVSTFQPEQFSALVKFSELVAPSGEDSPGAREAEAARFLDFLIGVSPQETIVLYKNGLDQLNGRAKQAHGKAFCELSTEEAKPMLAALEEPWHLKDSADPLHKFLRRARGDIVRATLNSRPYIDNISQTRRSRGGTGLYWYPMP